MPAPVFTGTVTQGQLQIDQQSRWDSYLRRIDGRVDISIQKHRRERLRSTELNKYYWGVVVRDIAGYMGETADWAHAYLKVRFILPRLRIVDLSVDDIIASGRLFDIARFITTTTLQTGEMMMILSEIRAWASRDLGLYIPEPNETEFSYSLI